MAQLVEYRETKTLLDAVPLDGSGASLESAPLEVVQDEFVRWLFDATIVALLADDIIQFEWQGSFDDGATYGPITISGEDGEVKDFAPFRIISAAEKAAGQSLRDAPGIKVVGLTHVKCVVSVPTGAPGATDLITLRARVSKE